MATENNPDRNIAQQAVDAAKSAAEAAKDTAKEVAEGVKDAVTGVTIPGSPTTEPPTVEEPTEPRGPLPPKREQRAPAPYSPTGKDTGAPDDARAQAGEYLTTAQGVRLYDTDHSLKAGARGPVLLQDHHLREKITHFDHERIPERVVHARGTGAHGVFQSYGTAESVCKAAFLAEGVETPVFVRFSQVNGSRGSADAVRDTRGFAVKFYTSEGNYDFVGNNIPVFFIQDAIKFPDVVHAVKPEPAREIPQAQSAHDTFWDFVSLHTEAQHHTIWQMGGRGIQYTYRTMPGFGVNTFRMVNAEGRTTLVKLHLKPKLGDHALVWEEAQMINGVDPDFQRRDLYDAIEAGAYPQWEFGIQTFPDTEDQTFEGIDLSTFVLMGASLAGVIMPEAELNAADLSGADLSGGDLREASLVGATLNETRFDGADLSGADFSGASLITLFPGDVLQSGTSGGTGSGRVERATGSGYLIDGETISASIEGIGTITHTVRREQSVPDDLSGSQLPPTRSYRN